MKAKKKRTFEDISFVALGRNAKRDEEIFNWATIFRFVARFLWFLQAESDFLFFDEQPHNARQLKRRKKSEKNNRKSQIQWHLASSELNVDDALHQTNWKTIEIDVLRFMYNAIYSNEKSFDILQRQRNDYVSLDFELHIVFE